MFTVYILENSFTGRHYIGCTNNLERRLEEHNRGNTQSTRHKGYWRVVYKEVLSDLTEALRREKQIKSYKGGNGLRKLLLRE